MSTGAQGGELVQESVQRLDHLFRRARIATLLLAFWAWFLVGVGILQGEGAADLALQAGVWHVGLPTGVRAAGWMVPAFLVLATLLTGRGARISVPLLVVGPLVRIMSYGWAWSLQYFPGSEGYASGWYYSVLHVTFLGLVAVAALLTSEDKRAHT